MTQGRSRSQSRAPREQACRGAAPQSASGADGTRTKVAVGLTGGIGAGKSTALSLFRELGAVTISADEVVHRLYAKPKVSAALVGRFGPTVLDMRGDVDRSALAESVRGHPGGLRWLEKLTHPRVAEEIERSVREAPPGAVIVCEVPLLFESHHEGLFDLIITVEAGRERRKERSTHRFDPEVFSEFDSLQASTEQRLAGSDLAFFNDGDVEQLRTFVCEAYARAVRLIGEER
jgi:dephospho-CoA kinase